MSPSDKKKPALIEAMAAHVLEHGLSGASLRPLARAAGTSDRMLIYHFGSKERLVQSLLAYIAEKLKGGLDASLPAEKFETRAQCVSAILALFRRDEIRPFARVWFEMLASAEKGDLAQRRIAGEIMASFQAWLADRVPAKEDDPSATAMALLALIEGLLVLDAAGHGEAAVASAGLLVGED